MQTSPETKSRLDFSVLLDKGNLLGLGELSGVSFLSPDGTGEHDAVKAGVVNSIRAVQNAGLMQTPTYLLVNGRAFADYDEIFSEFVWRTWYDTLGERLTLETNKTYSGIDIGQYVVDIQNGGLFVPRPDKIEEAVKNNSLVNGSFPISTQDIDLLLGDRIAYQWNGRNLETVEVTILSYAEFLESSNDVAFLRNMPVYVVLRSLAEAQSNPSRYNEPIETQLDNPDLIIPSGGKIPLRSMLLDEDMKPHFNTGIFGSQHDGYKNAKTRHFL